MKSSLFSTGLITLTALLSIKGASLVSDLYNSLRQNPTLGASTPIMQEASTTVAASTQIQAPLQTEADTSKNQPVKVTIDNKVVPDFSAEDIKIFESISKRSKELNQQQQNLELKEAALTAIENKITEKIQQLSLEQQALQQAANSYAKIQNEEIKSLANIYSNMKPKDAAAIFNELDMHLLIQIINAMKERNVAQIVSQMNHAKVKDLSIELAKSGTISSKKPKNKNLQ